MQSKEEIIKTYLFAICDTKGGRIDKDNLLKIWLQEFDYIDEKEDYMIEFMSACRKVLNDSTIFKIPSPDDIKHIIMEGLNKNNKSIGERPRCNPAVRDLFREFCKVLGEKNSTTDDKERERLTVQCNELIAKMQVMAK